MTEFGAVRVVRFGFGWVVVVKDAKDAFLQSSEQVEDEDAAGIASMQLLVKNGEALKGVGGSQISYRFNVALLPL